MRMSRPPIILRRIERPLDQTEVVDIMRGITTDAQSLPPGRAATQYRVRWPTPPLPLPPMQLTPVEPPGSRSRSKLSNPEGKSQELKKALDELADKGQIDHFLKKSMRFLRGEREATQLQPWDEECSTEVVATIVGGYVEGMIQLAWKAQLRGVQQVLTTEQGACMIVPTMVFGRRENPRFASPHNDPLVVEIKITSAIIRRILIDTGSSFDIITWDCLKKLTHPG
ncbi:hypothetical protein Cgig2_015628 [Carnegiea gigantea]|uniref:Gag-pol polyprotein n=1 Tax=Carnegiea gigantea TaxID=171969 RepID=A0A9Q1Q670_9CARY|nr:hypothetical protein Cgig2_015628 [Carnegiea gigantea]